MMVLTGMAGPARLLVGVSRRRRRGQPVLYGRGDVPDALQRACREYPSAAIYAFHLDGAHPQGWLEPMTCGETR